MLSMFAIGGTVSDGWLLLQLIASLMIKVFSFLHARSRLG